MTPKELKRLRKKIERKTITPEETRTYNAWATATNATRKAGRPIKLVGAPDGAPTDSGSGASSAVTDGTAPNADGVSLPSLDGPPPLDPNPTPPMPEVKPAAELVVGIGHKETAQQIVFGLQMADAYSGSKGGFALGPTNALWATLERSLARTIARHFPDMDGGLGEKYDEIVVGGVAGAVVAQAGWIAATGAPPFRFANPTPPVPAGDAPPQHAAEQTPPRASNGVGGLFMKAT